MEQLRSGDLMVFPGMLIEEHVDLRVVGVVGFVVPVQRDGL